MIARSNRLTHVLGFTLAIAATTCSTVCNAAKDAEEVKPKKASEVLGQTASGPNYRVNDGIGGDDLLYSFSVWSPFGWYKPQSMAMLQIRVREFNALACLNGMKDDPLLLEGAAESIGATVRATGSAIRQPVKTIASVPLGLQKFGKSIQARADEGQSTGESGGLLVQSAKRKLAIQLGVDPYSDNPQLQEWLNYIASRKNAGAIAARVGGAFVGGGWGTAISVSQLNKNLQRRLVDHSAAELQKENRQTLIGMGHSPQAAAAFLDCKGYTVTRTTTIVEALATLKGVRGICQYVTGVRPAAEPEVPLFHQTQIEMAAGFNNSRSKLTSLNYVGRTPVFSDAQGEKHVFAPIDLLSWNDEIIPRAAALGKSGGELHVWITGTATERALEELESLKIKVHEKSGSQLLL